ncbi:hypothetical protein L484_020451 [Morus notabilis]|uniref:Uncharacterized protein n=1 Tax=Morus notabilis TaxID=981085 RepID=W9SBP3_9ROSA|nr:hypothetical protein L484_020451 [Morus notabilis]
MAGAITTVIATRPLSMAGGFMEKGGSVTVHVAVKHPALGRPHTFSSKFITALVFQCRPTVSASEHRRERSSETTRGSCWATNEVAIYSVDRYASSWVSC